MMEQTTRQNWSLYLARTALLVACYYITGKIGLSLSHAHDNVTLVWPPAAFALTFVLFFGYRMWVGVALGAFLVNYTTDITLWAVLGITFGNTAMALVGTYLLRQQSFDTKIRHIRDVPALLFLGAISPTIVSATIGSTSLLLSGALPASIYHTVLLDWWLGDAMGILVCAPFLLALLTTPSHKKWHLNKTMTQSFLGGFVAILSALPIFTGWIEVKGIGSLFLLLPLPVIIWCAYNYGVAGVASGIVGFASVALIGTSNGVGPFFGEDIHFSFILFFAYVAVHLMIGLLFATALHEKKTLKADIRKRDILIEKYRNHLPDIVMILNRDNMVQHIYATETNTMPERFTKLRGKSIEEAMNAISSPATSQAIQTELTIQSHHPILGDLIEEEESFEYYFHFAQITDDNQVNCTAIFLNRIQQSEKLL